MQDDFHFYHELKKEKYYDPLIPQREAGLVIVLLYEQWKTGKFSTNSFAESTVKNAIEQVASDLGKTYERTPHERFKEINLTLQEYFLLRDEETNTYKITQYGEEFCEHIKEKLVREFRPSDIEKILADLIDSLKKYIEKGDFEFWYKHQFLPQRSFIKNQIETLFRQVDTSVKEFRSTTKLDDQTFLEVVRKIDRDMRIISDHSKELRDAFFDTEEMKGIIIQLSFSELPQSSGDYMNNVRTFLNDVNHDLNIISHRIERIRPKLRQFISSINQRNFDRNTETFLRYLLKSSMVVKSENFKRIELPQGIDSKSLHQLESDFIIVEGGRLMPKLPTPVVQPKKDREKREKQKSKANNDLYIRNRVRKCLYEIDRKLVTEGTLSFAEIYYDLLNKELRYGKTIVTKVAYFTFRKYIKLKNYEVRIDKQMVTNSSFPTIAIWKMNILKK